MEDEIYTEVIIIFGSKYTDNGVWRTYELQNEKALLLHKGAVCL